MKTVIRVAAAILCLLLLAATVLSARAEVRGFSLTVDSQTGTAGDTVCFAVDIAQNPGIMAITVTFHYDPAVLQFSGYVKGLIKKDTVVDHADRGYVSIVWCGNQDMTDDGTLFGMEFTVKADAVPGSYPVTLRNIHPAQYGDSLSGCFADYDRNTLKPTVTAGTFTVPGEEILCTEHQFSDWETVVEDIDGRQSGREQRVCVICGYTDLREVPGKNADEADVGEDVDSDEELNSDSSDSTADSSAEKGKKTASSVAEKNTKNEKPSNASQGATSESDSDASKPAENRVTVDEVPVSGQTDAEPAPDAVFQTADELVRQAQSVTAGEEQSALTKVFAYLFGTAERQGLLQVLWQYLKNLACA